MVNYTNWSRYNCTHFHAIISTTIYENEQQRPPQHPHCTSHVIFCIVTLHKNESESGGCYTFSWKSGNLPERFHFFFSITMS